MSDSYREAGVNIDAGNELVSRIGPALKSNRASGMLSGLGGFAALCKVPEHLEKPVMALGTDGVGTKLDLLIQHNHLHTVGQDLVAMCVNDLLVYGAEPALFLDYYATGKLDVDQAEIVIKSIAEACDMAGCALVGGETAEMPGFYPDDKFDLAGFCLGWVEEEAILRPSVVKEDDVIIGLAASGPHSNGFSLIRKILADEADAVPNELISAMLSPTRIYAQSLLPSASLMHAMANITGGGFKDNLPRAFPDSFEAHVDLNAWHVPEVFSWLQEHASIPDEDLFTTFNCGIGMTLFVESRNVNAVLANMSAAGEDAIVIGQMRPKGNHSKSGQLIVATDRFEFT